jgi:hypothetical protein
MVIDLKKNTNNSKRHTHIYYWNFPFYRGNKIKNKSDNNVELINKLQSDIIKLKYKLVKNKQIRDSIDILIIKNKHLNDKEIINIINMPDSTKIRLLSKRYNINKR